VFVYESTFTILLTVFILLHTTACSVQNDFTFSASDYILCGPRCYCCKFIMLFIVSAYIVKYWKSQLSDLCIMFI